MKLLYTILLMFITSTGLAQVEINGYVKNYDAVSLLNSNEYLILRNRLRLNVNYSPTDEAFGYASFDVKDDQLKGLELSLRELYIDLYFDNLDLRIGKQQIVWGEADGLFITDIVNPLDLREFILADFEDIRMGVNAIKAQAYFGDRRLEALWIPQFVPAKFSSVGEDWAFYTPLDKIAAIIPDSLIVVRDFTKPDKQPKNSEYGLRYSTLIKSIDFTLSWFRTWDDYPTFRQYYQPTQNPSAPFNVTITPVYDRINVYGGTFSTTVGSVVLRGEGAFYQNRNFYTADPRDGDRVVQKDFLNYMIGAEISPGNRFLSGQFVQEIIPDYDDQLVLNKTTDMGTILMTRTFFNETVKQELFLIYNFTDEDYLGRVRFYYYPSDGIEVIVGTDILGGKKKDTLFGQFDENDNFYLKVKYSF
ncbi:MAG: DUF1302 domain-containing protein [FCB group bacterium]|nr:DUF1302 domain-containing protein [FCB group bacterium]